MVVGGGSLDVVVGSSVGGTTEIADDDDSEAADVDVAAGTSFLLRSEHPTATTPRITKIATDFPMERKVQKDSGGTDASSHSGPFRSVWPTGSLVLRGANLLK